jgi:hypothetical protein
VTYLIAASYTPIQIPAATQQTNTLECFKITLVPVEKFVAFGS